MAQLVLSQIGATIGTHVLPQGLSVLGQSLSGAALGGTLGGLVGRTIDASLAPPVHGPRLHSLHIMESREGASLPLLYGRMRVPGQLIWASRFREQNRKVSAGKGGPKQVQYSYTVSLAVALCAGEVTRLGRVWANGAPLDLGDLNWRFYPGSADQMPDPLLQAVEGTDQVPAYRDTAYIVLEDLPLGPFGNRLPQLSFEVIRASAVYPGSLRQALTSINIIPASGEFVYATRPVRARRFPASERPLNLNASAREPDFLVSLAQMQADLPALTAATLQVAWFGDDLRAGVAKLRPGVETRDRDTVPYVWQVAGQKRGLAYRVSQQDGRPNYGGTPADQAVLEGLTALHQAGLATTLSPFLLMDIPAGTTRPGVDGKGPQPAFPWRGRIRSGADGQRAARAHIDAFMGQDGGFGYRHFILHYARLGAAFGRLEAFLIGSELVGLTRLRDDEGRFPFVEALISLAAEVRHILGPQVKLSYAADWTEYGAWQPTGQADVLFPLDPLWASPDIDFVAIDWYPPVTDWRDGDQHIDARAGVPSVDDPGYLRTGMAGGEAYDWFYSDAADREAQRRTPIRDTAHGEDWVFRPKDVSGWWRHAHYPRRSGERQATPTGWSPKSKPVRLTELGCAAVDRGSNAPNRFLDPKSDDSGLPPFSTGQRDDVLQRRMLEAALDWAGQEPAIEQVSAWCWDARPWPAFPQRAEVWSDGDNWARGHWLNGRIGQISLGEVIDDLLSLAGLRTDVRALNGPVDGIALHGPVRLRDALAPFMAAFDLICLERDAALVFRPALLAGPPHSLGRPVNHSEVRTRSLMDKAPWALQLSYVSDTDAYAPSVVEARRRPQHTPDRAQLVLPMVLGAARARAIAAHLLDRMLDPGDWRVSLGLGSSMLEPGDHLADADGRLWRLIGLVDQGPVRQLELIPAPEALALPRALAPPDPGPPPVRPADPELWVIDGPRLDPAIVGPLLACAADPWPGPVTVRAGRDETGLTDRAVCDQPAAMGQVVQARGAGPLGRWDLGPPLRVELPGQALARVSTGAMLAGANRLLVQHDRGWELIGFKDAELTAQGHWALSGLLRGLAGSPVGVFGAGARCVRVDPDLRVAAVSASEIGVELIWQAGGGAPRPVRFDDRAGRPWRVGHLRVQPVGTGWRLRWTRRGADIAVAWALPEAENHGRFRLRALLPDGTWEETETRRAGAELAGQVLQAEVSEIGPDGRTGPWVSILLPRD